MRTHRNSNTEIPEQKKPTSETHQLKPILFWGLMSENGLV